MPFLERLLDRLVAWSPVLLLGGLAALTYWLDAQIVAPLAREGVTRHDPDIVVERFRGVSLDAKGRPLQQLIASEARHFPDNDVTELVDPQLQLTDVGRPRLTVTADRGSVTGDRENAYFAGNVKAVRDAETQNGRTTGPITVTTEYLHVIPKEDKVVTDKAVTIEEPRGIIRATGLVLDDRAKTIVLRSNVSGTIQPGAVPK